MRKITEFMAPILTAGLLALTAGAAEWREVVWSPSPDIHEERMSPSVYITVYHDHYDDEPTVPYSPGIMIDRHIWPGQSIKAFDRITRESRGQDEIPTGTHLPLSLFSRGENGYGGEMIGIGSTNEPPSVTLCEKGSLAGNTVPVEQGGALRKVFYVGDCRDNPITGAVAKFMTKSGNRPEDYEARLDGAPVGPGIAGDGTLEYPLPPGRLTPGEHELIVQRLADGTGEFRFYPDIQRPYHNPVKD